MNATEHDLEDLWATIGSLIRVSPTVLIRDVRERSELPPERVDRALLALAREETIALLEHDRPLGVDPASLLWDGARAYNALLAV